MKGKQKRETKTKRNNLVFVFVSWKEDAWWTESRCVRREIGCGGWRAAAYASAKHLQLCLGPTPTHDVCRRSPSSLDRFAFLFLFLFLFFNI
jgi:hypothetical protein